MKKVGFIGLGSMGSAMAKNLLESGFSLRLYNRTPEKAKSFVEKGAVLVTHPSELFDTPGSIVISMVANDQAIEDVVFGEHGLEKGFKKDCIHLSMSTISPKLGQKLADNHKKHHGYFLAAPVFGLPTAAAARKLNICLAGDPHAKKEVEPILKELGQRIFDFGDNPISSMVMKLIGNFLIINAAEALGEGFNLGKKYGLDPNAVLSMLTQSIFPGVIYEGYGKRVAAQEFDPALFQLRLGLKDLTLLQDAATHVHAVMPVAEMLKAGLATADKMGRGGLDWSALTLFLNEGNDKAYKT